MAIRLYRGSLDSQMIEQCINEIEEDKNSKHLIIIPEHYSHEMEGMMVSRFGVIGINNISVVTPHRLAVNCLSANEQNYLSESGKEMMLVRAVRNYTSKDGADKKLCAIMEKSSFADNMMTLISELKRRSISHAQLEEAAAAVESERLQNKLKAAAYAYREYEQMLLDSEYCDMDDNIDALALKVREETDGDLRRVLDKDTRVWFMRFEEYLPQHMKLIEAMNERVEKGSAKQVTICLNYIRPDEKQHYDGEADIYELMGSSYMRLSRLADEERFFETLPSMERAEDIELMLRSIVVPDKCGRAAEDIELFESINPHGEVSYIARTIETLIRNSHEEFEERAQHIRAEAALRGKEIVYTDEEEEYLKGNSILRYRDFGILFGGAMDYSHVLDTVFNEHEIPYFADERIIMSEHPIAVQILSVFDLYATDWSYDAVFRYLSAGFVYAPYRDGDGRIKYANALSADEISRLDNYVCRYGIRGRKRWLEVDEWDDVGEVFARTWKDVDEEKLKESSAYRDCEAVNRILKKVREPFAGFLSDGATTPKEAGQIADAVIDFLERINMYQGLKALVAYFENESTEAKAHTIAQQFSQIWNEILHVIEQARITMEGIEMTFIEFGEYIRAGLSKCEISTIPSSLDAVYTGTIERSTSAPVKYLFVAGAVNGTYPSTMSYDGYFSDFDREALKDEIELAPTKDEHYAKQRYQMYRALRAAKEKVFISYPSRNSVGEVNKQSAFVINVREYFTSLPYSNDFSFNPLDENNITSRAEAKRNLLYNCASPIAKLPAAWRTVFEHFRRSGKYDKELEMLSRATMFYTEKPSITDETAHMLYNRDEVDGRIYSASSINTYAYCPMKYFLANGLHLKEERGADIRGDEVGTYIHKIIQMLCEEIAQEAKDKPERDWENLSENEVCDKVKRIVKETKENLREEIFDYRMRMRVMDRVEKTVSRSAVNVLNSMKLGKFRIKATELELNNTRLGEGVYINGIVDRVDTYEGEKNNYFRIIDYKSGKTSYDEGAIINGIDMQLMIYAVAVENYYREKGDEYSLNGVYYQHTRDEYIKKSPEEPDKFYALSKKNMYLNGMTYLPENPQEAAELIEAVSSEADNGGGYLTFSLNKSVSKETGIRMPDKKSYRSDGARKELTEKVKENIIGIDREIMSGNIAPHPYGTAVDNPVACRFCGFKAVCSFEKTKQPRVKSDEGASFGKEAE